MASRLDRFSSVPPAFVSPVLLPACSSTTPAPAVHSGASAMSRRPLGPTDIPRREEERCRRGETKLQEQKGPLLGAAR